MKLFLAGILFLLAGSLHAETMVDDINHPITLQKPAQRIISLAPDITEILFVIGAGSSVVGVISGSDYPVAAKTIPIVGSYTGLDLERILLLRPDLIITWSHTFDRALLTLKRFGIPVYVTLPHQLQDVAHTMQQLGVLTGHEKQSDQVAKQYLSQLNQLKIRYKKKLPVSVFYQIGDYSLITINKKSWINEAITVCGGRNVFANAIAAAPEVSWEAIVTANPEVIISDATNANWSSRWQAWPKISAVQHKKLYNINSDLLERAGPRLIKGVERLCQFLSYR